MTTRSGTGYDVHKLVEGRPLVLGGVTVLSDRGLDGHSDADVLTHAVMDALLGAAALGDIGDHFPDSDDNWKDARSIDLLAQVRAKLAQRGYAIRSIDSTVLCETPRLGPYRDRMRQEIGILDQEGAQRYEALVAAEALEHFLPGHTSGDDPFWRKLEQLLWLKRNGTPSRPLTDWLTTDLRQAVRGFLDQLATTPAESSGHD